MTHSLACPFISTLLLSVLIRYRTEPERQIEVSFQERSSRHSRPWFINGGVLCISGGRAPYNIVFQHAVAPCSFESQDPWSCGSTRQIGCVFQPQMMRCFLLLRLISSRYLFQLVSSLVPDTVHTLVLRGGHSLDSHKVACLVTVLFCPLATYSVTRIKSWHISEVELIEPVSYYH